MTSEGNSPGGGGGGGGKGEYSLFQVLGMFNGFFGIKIFRFKTV